MREGIQAAAGVLQRDLHREGPLRVWVPEHSQLSGHTAAQHPALLPRGVPRLGILARWQLGKCKFSKVLLLIEKIGTNWFFFTAVTQSEGFTGECLRAA